MIEVEMQGGVAKLTADSVNTAYMYHWWSYVTVPGVSSRRNVTGQFVFESLKLQGQREDGQTVRVKSQINQGESKWSLIKTNLCQVRN